MPTMQTQCPQRVKVDLNPWWHCVWFVHVYACNRPNVPCISYCSIRPTSPQLLVHRFRNVLLWLHFYYILSFSWFIVYQGMFHSPWLGYIPLCQMCFLYFIHVSCSEWTICDDCYMNFPLFIWLYEAVFNHLFCQIKSLMPICLIYCILLLFKMPPPWIRNHANVRIYNY